MGLRRQVRNKGAGLLSECDSGIHEELVFFGDTGIAGTGIPVKPSKNVTEAPLVETFEM
jgi:hypothetical protein